MTMTPEQAAQHLKAWEAKLAGRQPTKSEQQIMDHYRDIIEGVLLYDRQKQGDREGDL